MIIDHFDPQKFSELWTDGDERDGTELCICTLHLEAMDVCLLQLQLVAAYEILKCNFESAGTIKSSIKSRRDIVVSQLLQFWFLKKLK